MVSASVSCNAFQASYIEIPKTVTFVGDVVATSKYIVMSVSSKSSDGLSTIPQILWADLEGKIINVQNVQKSNPLSLFSTGDRIFTCFRDANAETVVQEIGLDGPVNDGVRMEVPFFYDDFAVIGDTLAFVDDQGNIDCYKDGYKIYTRPTNTPGDISRKQILVYGEEIAVYNAQHNDLCLLNPLTNTEKTINIDQTKQKFTAGWSCGSDYGMFFFNNNESLVQIDPKDGTTKEYLSYADTDIPPCSYGMYSVRDPIILDKDRVVYVYAVAEDITSEVILLTRLPKNPHTDKTILTIGGVGVSYDPLITHAVYAFNTNQQDYRVRLREYADIYPFDGPEEYQRVLATLISDMSTGKTDDILMGSVFFNFEKMGKNGAVVDMMPFLEKETELTADAWIPSVLNLMKTESAMYRFFPGFSFFGYFGNADYLAALPNYSVPNMMRLADTLPDGVRIFPIASPENLFVTAIIYGLDQYMDESGTFEITEEQVQSLLDYANRCGIYLSEEELMASSPQDYMRGKEVMTFSYVWSAQNYREIENLLNTDTLYVGSPTLDGSASICSPSTSVAISSASKHPEVCWEFIKILMSPEIQQKMIEQGMFPVSQAAYDTYIDKAIHPELRSSSEEMTFMTNDRTPVSVECTERLTSIIATLNTTNETDMLFAEIILEELTPALNGSKTAAETAKVLNSRINLYLQTNSQITS